jgi:hypothetical protein
MPNLLATRKVYISRILIRCKNESIEARTIVTVILYIEIFIKALFRLQIFSTLATVAFSFEFGN